MTGRLIAIVGPSGAGKDTLIAAVCLVSPDLIWVRRVITRPAVPGGEPYESVDRTEFERRRASGAFAFWWNAHGLLYGIPATIAAEISAGRTVLFNASRAALPAIQDEFPILEIIAITAPVETLARRLAERGREEMPEIQKRLERADWPVPRGAYIVRNTGPVDQGVAKLLTLLDPPHDAPPEPSHQTLDRDDE